MEIQDIPTVPLGSFNSNLDLFTQLFLQEFLRKRNNLNLKPQIHSVDSNITSVSITLGTQDNSQEFTIKLIELLFAVKIYVFDKVSNRFLSLNINTTRFLKPKLRNVYLIDSEAKLLSYFHKNALYDRLRDLFNCRILNKLDEHFQSTEKLALTNLSINTILLIARYLSRKDLLRFLSINSELYRTYNRNPEFWMGLYHLRFRRTGFKLNQIDWKVTYLNKIK